jgi:threonyl-tRNA synthetase
LRNAIIAAGLPFEVDEGGGAFYGPKIDVKIEDAIGREWQCSTVQFDFNLPERFDMTYVGADGQKHRPYMIHRALLGSIERFFGILIEHYEGKFPTWLAPVQIKLLAVGQDVVDYCKTVQSALLEKDIRVAIDVSNEKVGYKIRQSLNERVPYLAVIGKREAEAGTLSVRGRQGELGALTVDQLIDQISSELKG